MRFSSLTAALALVFLSPTVFAEGGVRHKVFQTSLFSDSPVLQSDCRSKPFKYDLLFTAGQPGRFKQSSRAYYVYDGARYQGSTTALEADEVLAIANDLKVTQPDGGRSFGSFFTLDESAIRAAVQQCDEIHDAFIVAQNVAKKDREVLAKQQEKKRAQELKIQEARLKVAEQERLAAQSVAEGERLKSEARAEEQRARLVEQERQQSEQAQRAVDSISSQYGVTPVSEPYNTLSFDQLIYLIKENGVTALKGKFFWVDTNDRYEVSQALDGLILLKHFGSENTIGITSNIDVINGQRFKSISKRPVKFDGVTSLESVLGAPMQIMVFSILN